jgi:hypothetical protein
VKIHVKAALVLSLGPLVGCASITSGTNQSVSVETRTEQGPLAGASCKLSNDKGAWYVNTPGSTMVSRSYSDMVVRCEKEALDPGQANVKSSTKAMAFGNILFGGIIGAGVDVATGAAYDYPPVITVQMGKMIVIAPPAPAASAAAAASPPGTPAPAVAPAAPAAPGAAPSGPAK